MHFFQYKRFLKFYPWKSVLILNYRQRILFSNKRENDDDFVKVTKDLHKTVNKMIDDKNDKIEEEITKKSKEDQEKIGIVENLKTCLKKEDFYEVYSNDYILFKKDIELNLYFLEYFSKFKIDNCLLPDSYIKDNIFIEIMQFIDREVLKFDSIYLLSLIDSLEKIEQHDFKIWNNIDYLITRTSMLKKIDILYFPVILKGFEHYFQIESSISAEELYEVLEYDIITKLKKIDDDRRTILKTLITSKKINEIIKIFIYFSKNLEGSQQLYTLLIEYFFNSERFNIYLNERENYSYLISLYYSSHKIIDVISKDECILNFHTMLEKLLIRVFRDDLKEILMQIEIDPILKHLLLVVLDYRRKQNIVLNDKILKYLYVN